jgi:hypothetical protein
VPCRSSRRLAAAIIDVGIEKRAAERDKGKNTPRRTDMSQRALLTILACIALAGCSTTSGPPASSGGGGSTISATKYKAKKCPTQCEIGVVVETPFLAANHLTLKDSQDNILVVPRRGRSKITWTLEARNHAYDRHFAFDVKGIDFGAAPVTCGHDDGNKSKFRCTIDTDDEPLTIYKYDIKVVVVSGSHFDVKPLDPWLIAE